MRISPNTFLFFAIQGDAFEFFVNSPFAGMERRAKSSLALDPYFEKHPANSHSGRVEKCIDQGRMFRSEYFSTTFVYRDFRLIPSVITTADVTSVAASVADVIVY